jgi:CheY-like chemotaxis protein
VGGTVDAEVEHRSTTLLRHRVRAAAHRIVTDCEVLLDDTAQPEWRLWREAVGEALLAGHQLRAVVERRFHASNVVLSRDEIVALNAQLREPQHRIVQAMTRVLGLVPTDLDDELLLGDARAIRDVALRLGSDDTAVMPVVREATPSDPAQRRHSQGDNGSAAGRTAARLLVVDDTEAPRKMLVRLLERLGYDVIAAAGGLEAMAIAERGRIDVIVSDIEMPECDGFELLGKLKANDATRDIPVIVVSGLGDAASVVRCIELGAEDHLVKPFDSLLLQARVRASLERKRLRDQELGYLRRVAQLTVAAEEVENATYRPGSLGNLVGQDDELGRLARVFDRVVSGWQSREARLQRRLRQFREEIQRSKQRPSVELHLLSGFGSLATGHLFAERYEIIEELGRGGMGVVYRACDRELGEEVAVKVMRAELLKTDPGLIERLKMEIRLARRITHPNVVRSHDFGEWQGMHFLTMEYVKGITVESLIETQGRLSVASTLAIGTQLAEALTVAHEQQIIHRDIKPANLLVDDEGVLKVTDFGLARPLDKSTGFTQHGTVVGTPRYMAPEQLFGNVVDERSDLFAVGVVLYECLTGMPPFDANTPTEIVARLLDGPPTSIDSLVPDVTPAFAALVDNLLRYEPRDRLQSARELVERLRELG